MKLYLTPVERIGRWTYLTFCCLVFIFLLFPLIVIIPLSFNSIPYFTFTKEMLALDPEGFSLRWYKDFWSSEEWRLAVKNSFIIAIFATLLATSLGTLAALGLSRSYMPFKNLIMGILISPLIVPIIISAVGMFFFFADIGLAKTYLGAILGHTVVATPFVVITVTASLSGFNYNLVRAAQNLGSSHWRTFRKIIFPLVTPGIIAGALFAFVASFDEVVIILFVGGFEQQTITVRMWSGIREEISPTILAVATLFLIISVFLLTTIELLRRRNQKLRGIVE